MCKKCGFSPNCKSSGGSWLPSFIRNILFGFIVLHLITVVDCFVPLFGRNGFKSSLQVSTLMPPADLTPAVDKFARLPSSGFLSSNVITAKGPSPEGPEPFGLVSDELQPLSDYVKELVVSENPVLTMAASHFFNQRQGKRFRPTIIALMGRAIEPTAGRDPEMVKQLQLQLGQITEMIHVASLIHDDVLDEADTRRGGAAVHTMYTNKVAVLAGDYLLARASVLLARLQHLQVVEVMASALDSLVQGEIMQARAKGDELISMESYLRKSYFKTASLISCSCKSAALLAGHDEKSSVTVSAEEFGYHLGMSYQIIDDILDFTGASSSLGKPAQADMALGLATAPILFASETKPELKQLILRRFKNSGDVIKAVSIATDTDCVKKSFELAEFHAQKATEALSRLPPSQSAQALMRLLHIVLSRDK
eukprot:gene178-307_t